MQLKKRRKPCSHIRIIKFIEKKENEEIEGRGENSPTANMAIASERNFIMSYQDMGPTEMGVNFYLIVK